MTSKRKNITLPKSIIELADKLMELRKFTDFSGFAQQLIREEWERRHGPAVFTQEAAATTTPQSDTHKSAEKPSKPARRKRGGRSIPGIQQS